MESGVLLHPTSLPGPWGTGTLGSEAVEFLQWLSSTGARVWQILPLSPPVFGLSPYQCLSSFAINPALISPEELHRQGLLTRDELRDARSSVSGRVSTEALKRNVALAKTCAERALTHRHNEFDVFLQQEWVARWSRFCALKEQNQMKPWYAWNASLPSPPQKEIEVHAMVQFLLEEQWRRVLSNADKMGIRVIGDLPIYTAHDSADVFFNRDIFRLGEDGMPLAVAGVPPDYFSHTGQLWGNPVYDWKASAETGHKWWTERIGRALELHHMVRIDHFRGFESYWEIPAGAETAEMGRWIPGPGLGFFKKLQKELGTLAVIAEDLGIVTDEVRILREKCGFPGMRVLQFALMEPGFDTASIPWNSVVYTGTHDNDTTLGWLESHGRKLGFSSVPQIIEMALNSPARLAVIPAQDILGLGSSARMNTPATAVNNWKWRLKTLPPVSPLSRNP